MFTKSSPCPVRECSNSSYLKPEAGRSPSQKACGFNQGPGQAIRNTTIVAHRRAVNRKLNDVRERFNSSSGVAVATPTLERLARNRAVIGAISTIQAVYLVAAASPVQTPQRRSSRQTFFGVVVLDQIQSFLEHQKLVPLPPLKASLVVK